MKAWVLKNFGLENLCLDEVDAPTPNAHEILVKIGAVSLNFRDLAIIDGLYEPHLVPKHLIPVSDAAGTVVAIGDNVTRFKVGDRVNSTLYSRWIEGLPGPDEPAYCLGSPLPGGLAEFMVLDENGAVKAPDMMTDEQASTLPIAALTAWYSLMDVAHLQAGQTVLVQGTGGVSIFATQIASAFGARVIATSSNDANLTKAKNLGASAGINYHTYPDWHQKVLELTNGLGADVTVDVAGGNGLNKSIAATRVGGVIAQVGFLTGQTSEVNLMPLIFRQTTIRGIAVAPRSAFERMVPFLDAHLIKPVIDKVYRFQDAPEAFRHLQRGPFGKVVIQISEKSS